MNLNIVGPWNNLSLGDCLYNLTYEFYKLGVKQNLFPINLDLSSFDKTTPEFANFLSSSAQRAPLEFKRDYPCFRLWHIQQSELSPSNNNYLFTFREFDQISDIERNILNQNKAIFVSCEHTKRVFEDYGVTSKVVYCPLGFDGQHFSRNNKKYFDDGRISFLIHGKFESRKCTEKTIKLWIKKYGNNSKYYLNLAITNPHFKPEDMQKIYAQIFNNQRPPFNINLLPYLKTRSELNDLYNSTDIVIDASAYETWSLPSFTCVALGKHAVLHNTGGIRGWANQDNASLFYPSSMELAHDGVFFHKDRKDFSFGNWYVWEDEKFIAALEDSVNRYNINLVNERGLELQTKFSWKNSAEIILNEINSNK